MTRRDFLKLAAALVGGALTPTMPITAQESSSLVTVRGDQFYDRGVRFPIRGFNYYPRVHPWRTFNVGEWEPRVTERELILGANLGANVVRMFIDFNASLDNTKAQQRRDDYFAPIARYMANVREFLDIAGRLNLKVIFTLFDSMDWSFYLPQNHWIADAYLEELLPPFINDPRILCWDLQNEPDRALRQFNADAVIAFFKHVSEEIRRLDPHHLQTIGWIDRARAQYIPALDKYLDFWCFHFYDKAERMNDLLKFYKTQTTKPVLLQEFGLATGGPGPDGAFTERDQAAHYETILAALEENKMCGSVFWALVDFPIGLAGNPPIQTDSPENHFGVFRLDYSEKPVAAVLRKYWRGYPLPGLTPQ
ncbi:MAG: cellulase family glycosylhydrolase [Chloroflexi bacterium]|nr:cellulase family glycosylhydrolase [Chloroflexota bacterium]